MDRGCLTRLLLRKRRNEIYMYMVGCVWKNVRRDRDGSVLLISNFFSRKGSLKEIKMYIETILHTFEMIRLDLQRSSSISERDLVSEYFRSRSWKNFALILFYECRYDDPNKERDAKRFTRKYEDAV